MQHHLPSFQCRVLLNLRTSQPFEEVLEDLGQVLKINGAKKMYTGTGQEVRISPRPWGVGVGVGVGEDGKCAGRPWHGLIT